MVKRVYKSNADRQRAYRERHRNAKATNVTPIVAATKRVTNDRRFNDLHYQYICTLDGQDIFAGVVYPNCCVECNAKRARYDALEGRR